MINLIRKWFGFPYQTCTWCNVKLYGKNPYRMEMTCLDGTVTHYLCKDCENIFAKFQEHVEIMENERLDDESLRRDKDVH